MKIPSITKMIKFKDNKNLTLVKTREQKGVVEFGLKDKYIIRKLEFYLQNGEPYDLRYTNTAARKASPKTDQIEDFNISDLIELWSLCNNVCIDADNIRRD